MFSLRRALKLLHIWPLLLIRCSGTVAISANEYPSEIRLSAGVVHSPPFAFVEEASSGTDMFPGADTATGEPTFRGFTIDLLERLKEFALMDNVDLQVDLKRAPEFYEDAFELVASDCDGGVNSDNGLNVCNRFDMMIGK